jgi:hypothetical protein
VQLLVNDLSLHGQFGDLSAFRDAMNRVVAMRMLAQRFGRALHCHRNMTNARVTRDLSLFQAIQRLRVDEKRALMLWLTQYGPFWEDTRVHGSDEYLECKGNVVTDTAIGEAAYCSLNGMEHRVLSLTPSAWEESPIPVEWVGESRELVDVINHWNHGALESALQTAPTPVTSWKQLAGVAGERCPNLTFSTESFEPLEGHPFAVGAAQRLLILLETLQRFRTCVDEKHGRTAEGQRLYQEHFTGDKAWFSDSSETEKNTFRTRLTFRRPNTEGESIFCPWHGKVKTPQLRIHFSWPVPAGAAFYVVYVGPKITTR